MSVHTLLIEVACQQLYHCLGKGKVFGKQEFVHYFEGYLLERTFRVHFVARRIKFCRNEIKRKNKIKFCSS